MKSKIVSYCKWFKRVVNWIKVEFKLYFLVLAYVAVGVLASSVVSLVIVNFYPKRFSSVIGLSGILLQLFGTIIVGFMISNRRKLFNLPTFMEKISRYPKLTPSPTMLEVKSSSPSRASVHITACGGGYAIVTSQPSDPVEERVNALEINLARQTKKIDDLELALNREVRSIREHISILIMGEKTERESDINNIKSLIEELAVGGIKWETVGLCWLFIGFILVILG